MKDIPLDEIILRKYEIPESKDIRELIKKFCLSIGLLQEGDSRDIIIDIILVLINKKKEKRNLNIKEIKNEVEKIRKNYGLEIKGLSESNIRRQLRRLKDLMIIEKIKNSYRLYEFENIENILERILEIKLNSIIKRIKEYAKAIDENSK
ncbi:MAG: hypothetical protein QXQ30_00160 [Candidatus Pacearchaeota archaeon]